MNQKLFTGFLAWTRRQGRARTTRRAYEIYGQFFFDYLDSQGVTDPRDVEPRILNGFQEHLYTCLSRRGRPYSTSARAQMLAWVRTFYGYLVEQELILVDPTARLKRPRAGRRLPKAILTPRQMDALLRAPDVTQLTGLLDRTILELLYGTGLRFSEMADLTVGDVDVIERTLWVRQGKGGHDRVLPLGRWAAHWLRRYLTASAHLRRRWKTDRIFVGVRAERLASWTLNMRLRDYAARVGITKHITLHSMRHTFATVLLRGGADIRKIQRLLGHTSLSATEIYTHLNLEDLRRVQATCHPRERGT